MTNDVAGWAELVARLHPLAVSAIGLEPSGGYERGIRRAPIVLDQDFPEFIAYAKANPGKLTWVRPALERQAMFAGNYLR